MLNIIVIYVLIYLQVKKQVIRELLYILKRNPLMYEWEKK